MVIDRHYFVYISTTVRLHITIIYYNIMKINGKT